MSFMQHMKLKVIMFLKTEYTTTPSEYLYLDTYMYVYDITVTCGDILSVSATIKNTLPLLFF